MDKVQKIMGLGCFSCHAMTFLLSRHDDNQNSHSYNGHATSWSSVHYVVAPFFSQKPYLNPYNSLTYLLYKRVLQPPGTQIVFRHQNRSLYMTSYIYYEPLTVSFDPTLIELAGKSLLPWFVVTTFRPSQTDEKSILG